MIRPEERESFAAWGIAALMVVATLLSGAGVYLKKIGVLEADQYSAYWELHCQGRDVVLSSPGFRKCTAAGPGVPEAVRSEEAQRKAELAHVAYLYRADGIELVPKVAKDMLLLGLIAWGAATMLRQASFAVPSAGMWLLLSLLALVAYDSVGTTLGDGWRPLLGGWRSFEFLLVAVFCGRIASARNMATLAAGVGTLMVLQLPLLLPEWLYGVYVHGDYAIAAGPWKRLVGSFVHPNSLGVFMATGLGFYYAFSTARNLVLPLFVMSLIVMAGSGSGTGAVCLVAFVIAVLSGRATVRSRPVLLLAGGAAALGIVLALPTLVHRPDAFDSLWGRLNSSHAPWHRVASLGDVILGEGIGQGTNTAAQLLAGGGHGRGADSLLYCLLAQVGLLGTTLFYAALLGGPRADRHYRPLLWILVLVSLTCNLSELFPANLLLGLTLAHLLRPRWLSVASAPRASTPL